MDELLGMYEDFVEPTKIINYFKTDEEFIKWCEMGSNDDLKWALIAFEDSEEYLHCAKIKKVLDKRLFVKI
jgi:hypothetical protein